MIFDAPKAVARCVGRSIMLERLARLTAGVEGALSTLARRPAPVAVHEARIAVRRLQASLRNMKHQFPSRERKGCMVALSAIMKECSAVRDADVRSRLVRHWLIRSGLKDHEQARVLRETAERERTEARRELRNRIHAPKWDKRLWKLRQGEQALIRSEGKGLPLAVIGNACERCRRPLRYLPEAMRKRRQLHRLRLKVKDARYFLEDYGSFLGAPWEGEMVQLRGLQKTLGDLHDEWQLRRWLRGQYKCYVVTNEMLTLLKAHKRQLLKRIRRLRDQSDIVCKGMRSDSKERSK
jgi:CHAD domain-containing protein